MCTMVGELHEITFLTGHSKGVPQECLNVLPACAIHMRRLHVCHEYIEYGIVTGREHCDVGSTSLVGASLLRSGSGRSMFG